MTLRRIEMRSSQPPRLGIMGRLPVFLLIMILSLAVVLTPAARAAPLAAGDWIIESIDSHDTFSDVGMYSSIALDSLGWAHISYYNNTTHSLKYATNLGGQWTYQTIDNSGGMFSSIAIDSNNNPCISYYNDNNHDLRFAYGANNGATWTIHTVDNSSSSIGYWTSIAVDQANHIHISYCDFNNSDLKYAYSANSGEEWSIQSVDSSSGDVGGYTSIAIDSSNNRYISYYDFTNHELKCAYEASNGATWTIHTVDNSSDVGMWGTSIAVDHANHIHISYYDNTNHDLKYAYSSDAGVTWTYKTADNSANVGMFSSIAVDSSNNPCISYYDNASWDLKYAHSADAGVTWTYQTVDNTAHVGKFTSIAIGAANEPHISYYDWGSGKLKYATEVSQPSAPLDLKAVVGNGQVTLSWAAPLDNASSPVTNYNIYRGTTAGIETLLKTVGNVLNYTDTSLTNGQTYYYKVSANNSAGEGSLSGEISATPVTVPSAPLNLVATPGNAKVTLNWNAPSSNGGSGTITNYQIYRGTTSGGEEKLTTVGNVLTYTDTGLSTTQNYYYKVKAVNVAGEGPFSNEVPSMAVTAPSAPQNIEVTKGDGQMVLTWTAPADNGGSAITGYKVYRNGSLIATLGNVLTYTDTGLTNGQTYHYSVSAINSAGESTQTEEVSATPIGTGGNDSMTWILLIALVVIVGISASFLYLRRKKKI